MNGFQIPTVVHWHFNLHPDLFASHQKNTIHPSSLACWSVIERAAIVGITVSGFLQSTSKQSCRVKHQQERGCTIL
jgi:hypothetical protein